MFDTVRQRLRDRYREAPAQAPTQRCQLELGTCWAPGLVLRDWPPQAADVCWEELRAWIEQGFKRFKRGGWQWHYTRMEDPTRAERRWLAVAIATWWLLSVGGESEQEVLAQSMGRMPGTQGSRRGRWRLIAVFHRGWTHILAALGHQKPLPLGKAWPEPRAPGDAATGCGNRRR